MEYNSSSSPQKMESLTWSGLHEESRISLLDQICKFLNKFHGQYIACKWHCGLLLTAERSRRFKSSPNIIVTIKNERGTYFRRRAFTYQELIDHCMVGGTTLDKLMNETELQAPFYDEADNDVSNQEIQAYADIYGDNRWMSEDDLYSFELVENRVFAPIEAEFRQRYHEEFDTGSGKTPEKVTKVQSDFASENGFGSVDGSDKEGSAGLPGAFPGSAISQASVPKQSVSSLSSWSKVETELDWNAMAEEDLCKFLNLFHGHRIEYATFCGMQNYTGIINRCRPIGRTILLVVKTPQGSYEYISSTYPGVFNGCLIDGKNLTDFIADQDLMLGGIPEDEMGTYVFPSDESEVDDDSALEPEQSYDFGSDIESGDLSKDPAPRTPSPEMPELEPLQTKNEVKAWNYCTGRVTQCGNPSSSEDDQQWSTWRRRTDEISSGTPVMSKLQTGAEKLPKSASKIVQERSEPIVRTGVMEKTSESSSPKLWSYSFAGPRVREFVAVKNSTDPKQLLLDTLYLAEPDVYLVSKDKVKHGAHKLVLAARSTLFKTVFEMADPAVPQKEMIMDYSSGVLEAFLQLIYAQPCPGLRDYVCELVEIFGEFGVTGDLLDFVGEGRMAGVVTPGNAGKLFFTAAKHRQFGIWERAVEVLRIRKDVREGEEFEKLKTDGLFLDARGIDCFLDRRGH